MRLTKVKHTVRFDRYHWPLIDLFKTLCKSILHWKLSTFFVNITIINSFARDFIRKLFHIFFSIPLNLIEVFSSLWKNLVCFNLYQKLDYFSLQTALFEINVIKSFSLITRLCWNHLDFSRTFISTVSVGMFFKKWNCNIRIEIIRAIKRNSWNLSYNISVRQHVN